MKNHKSIQPRNEKRHNQQRSSDEDVDNKSNLPDSKQKQKLEPQLLKKPKPEQQIQQIQLINQKDEMSAQADQEDNKEETILKLLIPESGGGREEEDVLVGSYYPAADLSNADIIHFQVPQMEVPIEFETFETSFETIIQFDFPRQPIKSLTGQSHQSSQQVNFFEVPWLNQVMLEND